MHLTRSAAALAPARDGNNSAARIAIMAMTTSSSIRVKAFAPRPVLLLKAARIECRDSTPPRSFVPLKNLLIGPQALAQFRVIDLLHRLLAIDRQARGGCRRLTQNHEHRLHANRAVRDVRGRQANRHE